MRRLRIILGRLAAGLVLLTVIALVSAAWLWSRQGVPEKFWATYSGAQVHFDAEGIPTIEAATWGDVIRAQGYVVASDRLFQMDLIRRKAGGRLAELFGAAALTQDAMVQSEDRLQIVAAAAAGLAPDQRQLCADYADGVNAFIKEHPGAWGIEYAVLRLDPAPWTCADSMLVLLEMNDSLSATAAGEAQQYSWRRNLSPAWQALLFTQDHPWNKPYFLADAASLGPRQPQFPPRAEYVPARKIDPETELKEAEKDHQGAKQAAVNYVDPAPIGSNDWAWRGSTGAFLANDPHLAYSVPALWYAARLRVSKSDWVVGATIPGIPGVVLGMNPHLAWAFTNSGEDVDDYLAEHINAEGTKYLDIGSAAAGEPGGAEIWRDITTKTFNINVRGETEPRQVTAQFTHRGPLAKRQYLGDGLYSRQWLALRPEMLSLATMAVMRAKSVEAFVAALDLAKTPSQNVLYMDRAGNMGYRMSGTGVVRKVTGLVPQPATLGQWQGYEPYSKRRQLLVPADRPGPQYLATANQRLWLDPLGANWFSDDRWERIDRYLKGRNDLTQTDMEHLQLDTESRFRRLLLGWIATRAGVTATSADSPEARQAQSWLAWDGSSRSNTLAFTQAARAEELLTKLLLARVQARFTRPADREVPYLGYMRRAWETALLEAPDESGVAAFGLQSQDLARFLLHRTLSEGADITLHPERNRWRAQHPFVGRVPLIGPLFRIEEFVQWGARDTVLAEQPSYGPSMRLMWNLRDPSSSTWIFPVGQSGHMLTKHYNDLHTPWAINHRLKVFDDGLEWVF